MNPSRLVPALWSSFGEIGEVSVARETEWILNTVKGV
jgi:hypothetical protein